MPWGVVLPLALSALGTGLGVAGSAESNNAANKAANSELSLQEQFDKQGQKAFQSSLSQSTPQAVNKQIGQGAQVALQDMVGLNQKGGVPGGAPIPTSNPQTQATQNAQVASKTQQQNESGAQLEGYGSEQLAQYIKDLQAQTQLGQIGTFAKGWGNNVFPLQLQQAAQKGQPLSAIGSLLSSVGGLGALYGATNSANPSTGYSNAMLSKTFSPFTYGSGVSDWNLNNSNLV